MAHQAFFHLPHPVQNKIDDENSQNLLSKGVAKGRHPCCPVQLVTAQGHRSAGLSHMAQPPGTGRSCREPPEPLPKVVLVSLSQAACLVAEGLGCWQGTGDAPALLISIFPLSPISGPAANPGDKSHQPGETQQRTGKPDGQADTDLPASGGG